MSSRVIDRPEGNMKRSKDKIQPRQSMGKLLSIGKNIYTKLNTWYCDLQGSRHELWQGKMGQEQIALTLNSRGHLMPHWDIC